MTYLAMITLEMQQQTTSQTTQPHFWVAEWLQWTSPGACSQQAQISANDWFGFIVALFYLLFQNHPNTSAINRKVFLWCVCWCVPKPKRSTEELIQKKAANCQCAHFFLSQEVNQVNSRICGHLVGTPKKSDKTFSRSCCGDQDSSP